MCPLLSPQGPTQMGLQATVTLNQEMLDRSNIPVDEDSNQEAVEAKIPDKNAPRCTVA